MIIWKLRPASPCGHFVEHLVRSHILPGFEEKSGSNNQTDKRRGVNLIIKNTPFTQRRKESDAKSWCCFHSNKELSDSIGDL